MNKYASQFWQEQVSESTTRSPAGPQAHSPVHHTRGEMDPSHVLRPAMSDLEGSRLRKKPLKKPNSNGLQPTSDGLVRKFSFGVRDFAPQCLGLHERRQAWRTMMALS